MKRQDRNQNKAKPEYLHTCGFYSNATEAGIVAKRLNLKVFQVNRSNNRWKKWCAGEIIPAHDPNPKQKGKRSKNKKAQ
jgi:hypothetical protein